MCVIIKLITQDRGKIKIHYKLRSLKRKIDNDFLPLAFGGGPVGFLKLHCF